MDRDFEIADFIVAFVNGGPTREQIDGLAGWLEESGANRAFFSSLLNEENFKKQRDDYDKIEWEKAFEQVRVKVYKKKIQKRRMYFMGVAAVTVIMVITGILMFGFEEEKNDFVETDKLIFTGRKNAYLTLGSGDKIVLSKQDTLLKVKATDIHVARQKVVYRELVDGVGTREPEYNTLETPQGTEFQVVLSDGTKVWLNAESKLCYPVNFVGEERRVCLAGEAYFEVVRNDEIPFVVETSQANIFVHGTEFCVRDDYLGRENLTTLVSGSVSVHKHGGKTYSIKPGQQVSILGDSVRVAEVETMYFTSWKDGYFIFNQATLGEIMNELAKWYDFDYFFVGNTTANIRLTARMKKYDDVNPVLNMLSRAGNVLFSSKGRVLMIESNR